MFTAAGQTLPQQYPTGGQARGMNLLIRPSITSTDLLSPSESCKIHPLVMTLFPVKIKQLPSADRVKYFVKN